MPHTLPTTGRTGAHRPMGSSSGVDPLHEHNELPPSAETTAISSKFHLYQTAAERSRWEAMALGYDQHGSGAGGGGAGAGGKKKAKAGSKAVRGQEQQYLEVCVRESRLYTVGASYESANPPSRFLFLPFPYSVSTT